MTLDDFFALKRVSDPQISPDGRQVAYAVGTPNMVKNKIVYNLWIAPTEGKPSTAQALTTSQKSDRNPRWSPDGKWILFESTRSGDWQLWIIPVGGGEAKQLTTLSTGASGAVWSRDGKRIAFVSSVWPEFSAKPFHESDALNKNRFDERDSNPVKAKVYTHLFIRHWDEYVDGKRQHLFVMDFDDAKAAMPHDATPGDRDAYPTGNTFSSGEDFTFSPDGKYLVFTAAPANNEAWSTNYDICRVPIDNKSPEWECLTKDNLAADSGPQFSPDGKHLAWRAQSKAGYEADRWKVVIAPCDEEGRVLASAKVVKMVPDDLEDPRLVELSTDTFVWHSGSDGLYITGDHRGRKTILTLPINAGRAKVTLSSEAGVTSVSSCADGKRIAYLSSDFMHPPAACVASTDIHMPVRVITGGQLLELDATLTKEILRSDPNHLPVHSGTEAVKMPEQEWWNISSADGTPMQMWIIKPPNFDEKKKWPLVYLVHGGPQSAWENAWSWRWNPALWAAQGYVVALPNPRGSTGFGQKYSDEISKDWGGKVYEDLMAGVAHMEKQPYIDKDSMAAAGASFGGYMMNWFAVNNGKFKTLISHCGVWNFDSMHGTTDELWFDEWEHGIPWEGNREQFTKYSPNRYAANLSKFKTPMLIIHNDYDYRVPVSEGWQLFTTLQRQGIESRFVNFPDEGHWVLKPANSRYWHEEVFAWLKKYAPPGPQ